MQSFIAIAHSYQKLYRGGGGAESAPPPPSQKSSKKPILNRVRTAPNGEQCNFGNGEIGKGPSVCP